MLPSLPICGLVDKLVYKCKHKPNNLFYYLIHYLKMASQALFTTRFQQLRSIQNLPKKEHLFQSVDYKNGKFNIGFTNNNVVGGTEKLSFSCKMCYGLPRDGIELRDCGHTYCRPCIDAELRLKDPYSLSVTFACPYCRSPFMKSEIIELGKTSKHLLGLYIAVDVRCAYGCGFVSNPSGTVEHERWKCTRRPVACPNFSCTSTLTAEAMDAHLEVCQNRLVYCALCMLPHLANSRHECVEDLQETINCVF